MPSDQDPNLRIPSLSKASIAAATPIKQVFTPGFHGYAQSGNHLSDKYAGMANQYSSDSKGGTFFARSTRTGAESASPFSTNFKQLNRMSSGHLESSKSQSFDLQAPCGSVRPFAAIYSQIMPRSTDEIQNSLQMLAKNVRLNLECSKITDTLINPKLAISNSLPTHKGPNHFSLLGKRTAPVSPYH
jgi:hypothetical protein